MNSIAIALRLAPARILDEPDYQERVLRFGTPLWEPDPALPVRREPATFAEVKLAAFAVAIFRRQA